MKVQQTGRYTARGVYSARVRPGTAAIAGIRCRLIQSATHLPFLYLQLYPGMSEFTTAK